MPELNPGDFTAIFARMTADATARSRLALLPLTTVIEKQAKINARNGSHKRGTPTPARPGEGPAKISGTLADSITHDPIVMNGTAWESKIGTEGGKLPPYGKTKTASSVYGLALETGLRNGAKYPFLTTALKFATTVAAPTIYKEAFASGWKQMT